MGTEYCRCRALRIRTAKLGLSFYFLFPSPNIQIRKLPLPPHTMKLFQLEWQQNYAASSSGNSSNYFQLPALLMHMHRGCAGRGEAWQADAACHNEVIDFCALSAPPSPVAVAVSVSLCTVSALSASRSIVIICHAAAAAGAVISAAAVAMWLLASGCLPRPAHIDDNLRRLKPTWQS